MKERIAINLSSNIVRNRKMGKTSTFTRARGDVCGADLLAYSDFLYNLWTTSISRPKSVGITYGLVCGIHLILKETYWSHSCFSSLTTKGIWGDQARYKYCYCRCLKLQEVNHLVLVTSHRFSKCS